MMNDMMMRLMGQIQGQQPQQSFPPFVGMAPPQQPLPGGGQALQPFTANGPYAWQALRLAGLLGGPGGAQPGVPMTPGGMPPGMPPRPVGSAPYTPGMFMPGFRPGIDQPIRGGGGKPPYRTRQV